MDKLINSNNTATTIIITMLIKMRHTTKMERMITTTTTIIRTTKGTIRIGKTSLMTVKLVGKKLKAAPFGTKLNIITISKILISSIKRTTIIKIAIMHTTIIRISMALLMGSSMVSSFLSAPTARAEKPSASLVSTTTTKTKMSKFRKNYQTKNSKLIINS